MQTDELRRLIRAEFPLEPATAYRLKDAFTADAFGLERQPFIEAWRTWDEIEHWQLSQCDVLFSYAPVADAAYFIPRMMLYVLDEIEGREPEPASESGDCFVWWLLRQERSGVTNVLTASQNAIVHRFLEAIAEDPNYRITLEVGGVQF